MKFQVQMIVPGTFASLGAGLRMDKMAAMTEVELAKSLPFIMEHEYK